MVGGPAQRRFSSNFFTMNTIVPAAIRYMATLREPIVPQPGP